MNGKPKKSLESSLSLRSTKVSGAKDFYILYGSLEKEAKLENSLSSWQQALSLFLDKRNRFALITSFIGVMGQQYGGVNILVSYTPTVLTNSGLSSLNAVVGSIGIEVVVLLLRFFPPS